MQNAQFPHGARNTKKIILIAALAVIIAGVVFLAKFPAKRAIERLDLDRVTEAENLERSLEQYLLREARRRKESPSPLEMQ